MKQYQFAHTGKQVQAVQWDGSVGQAKGINFFLSNNSDYTLGLGSNNTLTLSLGTVKWTVNDGDWIILEKSGKVRVVSADRFNGNFNPVKE